MLTSQVTTQADASDLKVVSFPVGAPSDACGADREPIVLQMRNGPSEVRETASFSNGWFALCFSHELQPGKVRTVLLMEREIVVYRTQSGLARAIDPYCPHLGAHLGRGGTVDGEDLVCPFHRLAFGPDGRCVRSGHGGAPPRAALARRHLRELNGVILVWVHQEGLPPAWEPPPHKLTGLCPPHYGRNDLHGYYQDPGENNTDVVHFQTIHGFQAPVMSVRVVDNILEVEFSARWKGQQIRGNFRNYDVGCISAYFEMPALGVSVWVPAYATPTGPFQWSLRWVICLSIGRVDRLPAGLRAAIYAVLGPLACRWVTHVSNEDSPIWRHRSHRISPKLMADDRPISIYRRWSLQFYSDATLSDPHSFARPDSRAGDAHAATDPRADERERHERADAGL